jgi:hypothetical protein
MIVPVCDTQVSLRDTFLSTLPIPEEWMKKEGAEVWIQRVVDMQHLEGQIV